MVVRMGWVCDADGGEIRGDKLSAWYQGWLVPRTKVFLMGQAQCVANWHRNMIVGVGWVCGTEGSHGEQSRG